MEMENLSKWHGSSIDIDDRKRAEEQLIKSAQESQRSEAYLAEAQRLSHTGSFGWKPGRGEIVWSDETYRIFEYDRAEKPTLDMLVQRVHPQDEALFQQVLDRASQTSTGFEHEYRLLLADGRIKHVHTIAHVLEDASGNREFVGAVTDITERKTQKRRSCATREGFGPSLMTAPKEAIVEDRFPTMAEMERTIILAAYRRSYRGPLLAARLLGIGKTTMYRKLREMKRAA
jgi:PAS domain S-box-containing protein